MEENSIVKSIIEKYYQSIYNYCYSKLNFNHAGAEDCAQEVFFTLVKKQKKLNLSDNIKLWLYRTADNVIMAYRRKNKLNDEVLNIDEVQIPVPNDFEVTNTNSSFERISEEDYLLLEAYYNGGYGDKDEVARKFNMTLSQLYKRIHNIKSKLK